MNKKFYITTPIYYINDVPHIGHTCTTLAADILARLHRQLGEEVFFLTGTDEHGEKVAEVAEKEGLSPIDYCNRIAPRFEEAWKNLNFSYDFFIRTTDPRHEKVVAEVLQKIYDSGDVYKGKYEGWYCTGCESFKTEKELVDGHCPLHPPEKTVWKSEENWFFKLSKYVPQIIKLIEDPKTNYIFPESKKSEVLAKLKAGVNDISISREKVKWGIPVPWDTNHTIYVWIDALINYYSATRFVEGKENFWPADLHLLGKEILWFHTVIWQAMLLSAKIDLPKKTYTHSFYIIDGQKMSKSLGNVISPKQLVDLYGVDGARYLVARSFPSENDSDVGISRFTEKYNADLANNLGNLVSRICKLGSGVKTPLGSAASPLEEGEKYQKLIDELKLDEAIGWVFEKYIDKSNNRLNEVAPWKLEPNDPKRVGVLIECANNLKLAAFYLKPVIPDTAEKIEKIIGEEIKPLEGGLFPRIKEETKVVEKNITSNRQYWVDEKATKVGVKFQVAEIYGVAVKRKNPELEKAKKKVTGLVQKTDYTNDLILEGYKKLFETVGAKNVFSSPDSLIQLVKDKGALPTINTVVDAYNVKSIETKLVVSAHDLDKLKGNVRIVTTTGKEVFYPLGSATGENLLVNEWAAVDDGHVLCRLNCKQSELSKVTPTTKNLLIYVQGSKATSDEYLQKSLKEICEYIVKYNGGKHVILKEK